MSKKPNGLSALIFLDAALHPGRVFPFHRDACLHVTVDFSYRQVVADRLPFTDAGHQHPSATHFILHLGLLACSEFLAHYHSPFPAKIY